MVSPEPERLARDEAGQPTQLTEFSAVELARLVQAREVSAREVTTAHLIRIGELNDAVNALLLVDVDQALAAAEQLDERLRRSPSAPVGALAGVPFVVKDNIDVHAQATT
ncbi:MAG: amidase family protein, partial [Ornithinimicrobium sp.]